MSRINVLDSSIYNRISAGEVVERPASVVKELIENSLDAKASSITIEIKAGGIKLIKITDNGVGLEYEDLKKAFLPHATSKISNVDDLDSIATLGFRGEALASISAVSRVEMYSKTLESEVGGKIIVNGGAFEEVTEYGCAVGTTIIVKDLFYNTPARLKFLKGVKQEENAITNIINRLILANPNIAVKYIVDDKVIYNSIQKGLEAKIYDVYGKDYVTNLIKINVKNGLYKLNGFISLPSFCKANKTYQTLIVNGRYVTNSLISVAVSNAYENFLMKGKFPVFIINIEVDCRDIDVNVHPSKMEVKFKDTKNIFSLVYESILQTLNENNCPVTFQSSSKILDSEQFYNFKNQQDTKPDKTLKKVTGGFSFNDFKNFSNEINSINASVPVYKNDGISVLRSNYTNECSKYLQKQDNLSNLNENKVQDNNRNVNDFENTSKNLNNKYRQPNIDFNSSDAYKKESLVQQKIDETINYKIIGTLFNTYIIVESNNTAYVFDQHAGHERILFDNLIKMFEEKKLISQPLLLPYVFTVNEIEDDLIQNNFKSFENFGFEIEPFGNCTYKISSIPSVLDGINLKEFINDMLSNTIKISATNEQIKNKFATMACKAAIKGGQKLSEREIEILLKKVLSNNTTLLCPHGRPICVKLTEYEIEKMFKRII